MLLNFACSFNNIVLFDQGFKGLSFYLFSLHASLMVKICSDNPEIEKAILSLSEILEHNGSYIDPSVQIHDENGQTSVFISENSDPDYIFKLQHETLVAYDNFDFDVQGQDIVIAHADRNDSKHHLDILETMVALYNMSGKFQNHLNEYPLLSFDGSPDLVGRLLEAREGQDVDIIKNMLGEPEFFDELALLTFFKSRLLHCRLYSKDAARTAVMIPVAEFMNHHPWGSGFDNLYGKQTSFMVTQAAMPIPDSRETFTSYGRFDALDTYLHYGFVDESAQYLRSIPLEIDLDDLGKISVRAYSAVVPVDKIPEGLKDLAFYFPQMQYHHDRNLIEVSHLYIPQENGLFSLRRILEHIIKILKPDIDKVACLTFIGETENRILELNENYYQSIKLLIENSKNTTLLNSNVLLLSDMQKKKIVNYRSLVNR